MDLQSINLSTCSVARLVEQSEREFMNENLRIIAITRKDLKEELNSVNEYHKAEIGSRLKTKRTSKIKVSSWVPRGAVDATVYIII